MQSARGSLIPATAGLAVTGGNRRRLRATGVSLEDRQDLLGHEAGRVTTHYSFERDCLRGPLFTVARRCAHEIAIEAYVLVSAICGGTGEATHQRRLATVLRPG